MAHTESVFETFSWIPPSTSASKHLKMLGILSSTRLRVLKILHTEILSQNRKRANWWPNKDQDWLRFMHSFSLKNDTLDLDPFLLTADFSVFRKSFEMPIIIKYNLYFLNFDSKNYNAQAIKINTVRQWEYNKIKSEYKIFDPRLVWVHTQPRLYWFTPVTSLSKKLFRLRI